MDSFSHFDITELPSGKTSWRESDQNYLSRIRKCWNPFTVTPLSPRWFRNIETSSQTLNFASTIIASSMLWVSSHILCIEHDKTNSNVILKRFFMFVFMYKRKFGMQDSSSKQINIWNRQHFFSWLHLALNPSVHALGWNLNPITLCANVRNKESCADGLINVFKKSLSLCTTFFFIYKSFQKCQFVICVCDVW